MMEYMLFSTEKYNFFQSRNPGMWALPIPGFGIPGLQSLGVFHLTNRNRKRFWSHWISHSIYAKPKPGPDKPRNRSARMERGKSSVLNL